MTRCFERRPQNTTAADAEDSEESLASEGRHQSGGLASTLEGDVRCSADATTVASSNAVRAAHVEFCQSVHRICTDTESSTEEIRMPARVWVDSF